MAAAYGLDVRDPALSLRRFAVLLDHMPPVFRRPGQEWSTEAELLALLVDAVANLTYVTMRASGAKNAPRPRPLPRPGSRHVRAGAAPPRAPGGSQSLAEPAANSWLDAARQMAAIPGVVVRGDG